VDEKRVCATKSAGECIDEGAAIDKRAALIGKGLGRFERKEQGQNLPLKTDHGPHGKGLGRFECKEQGQNASRSVADYMRLAFWPQQRSNRTFPASYRP